MKIPFYIANRIAFTKGKSFSSFIVRIAIVAVSLSVATLIISSCLIKGFQHAITEKIFNSWGHIHITPFLADAANFSNNTTCFKNDTLVNKLKNTTGIKSINTYTVQSCIAKTNQDIEGVLLKGFEESNDITAIKPFIQEGNMPKYNDTSYSNHIVISTYLQKKLKIKLHDKLLLYFLVKNNAVPKARKVQVSGIYETGLEEYDKIICFVDSKLIQAVNDWTLNQINGYEIYLQDASNVENIKENLYAMNLPKELHIYTLRERFSLIFSWLGLMKKNELVIFIISLLVAIINMITAILILILERTRMVGILKTIGMQNFGIQQVFIILCTYIVLVGMFFGNALGIGLALIQRYTGIISLDQSIYYISKAPIYFDWPSILFINSITLLVCILLLIIPTIIIKTIQIVKAISYR